MYSSKVLFLFIFFYKPLIWTIKSDFYYLHNVIFGLTDNPSLFRKFYFLVPIKVTQPIDTFIFHLLRTIITLTP